MVAYSAIPNKVIDPELPSYDSGFQDYEAQEPILTDAERIEFEFEVDDTAAEHVYAERSLWRRYQKFLGGYKYPVPMRIIICFWYLFNIYFVALVLFYSQITMSNYTLSTQHSNAAWPIVAERVYDSCERILPGSTQDLPDYSLVELPDDKSIYHVYHLGVCKVGIDQSSCSGHDGVIEFILKNLAKEVTEPRESTDGAAAVSKVIEAVSRTIDRHTVCTKRRLLNFFARECITEGIDQDSLKAFSNLKSNTEQSRGRKLWYAVALSTVLILVLDLYGWLVTANVDTFSITWGFCYFGNFFIRLIYLSWIVNETPDFSVLHGIEVKLELGGLPYIVGATWGTQILVGILIFVLWKNRKER